ncbi:serine/threonine-protein kinase [Phormidium sp. CCY1219]|uniref:serine/threonine-protein kinase n=1 Tax=Phormidium sp. CCY1219 TaxID=2886104 RepID=UPI002D1EEC80|nr:serine/threonine-protein kinase [Phormidium sp. CCY1219]MEB3829932.1 serine/threonine protein kinase [Phormidium sp. CCY1219]
MSLCINPHCRQPDRPDNLNRRYCQSCGSDLLLEGRYRIMRLLSDRSGFGNIYEVDHLGIPKILKVLKQEWNSNAKAVELFQREVKVLGQLSHPGIPQVDSYFQYQTKQGVGLHCIVMEKIEGVNLQEWLDQRHNQGITQEQAIEWLKEIADILQLVHEKQFFHRDIKPPNIMLRPNGQLVLIDFGTARQETYTYLAKMGGAGSITSVSSAGYTPPEQQNGQALPQSDFFALGRTFVYLLTGEEPVDLYDAHNDELNWRGHVLGTSPLFLNFIDSLMARIPSKRPWNARELLQRIGELERQLETPPNLQLETTVDLNPPPNSSQEWRNPLLYRRPVSQGESVLLTGLLILGALGGAGVGLYSALKENPCVFRRESYCDLSLANTLENRSIANSMVISPDGQTLVTGSDNKTIKIWNLATGDLIHTLEGHVGRVNSVAISPDGQTLVSGSDDKTIKIWNRETGDLIRTLEDHFGIVNSVAISADGQTLVSGSDDARIKVWNLETGDLIRSITNQGDYPVFNAVQFVAISPDGQTLVSGSSPPFVAINIWDLATGDFIRTLEGTSSMSESIAISPDGQTLVIGTWSNIRIRNLASGHLIRTLYDHSNEVNSVAISPDGQTLVSGSDDNTIKIWNLATGNLIRTLEDRYSNVYSVAISPDGQTLVGGIGDTIKIWRKK